MWPLELFLSFAVLKLKIKKHMKIIVRLFTLWAILYLFLKLFLFSIKARYFLLKNNCWQTCLLNLLFICSKIIDFLYWFVIFIFHFFSVLLYIQHFVSLWFDRPDWDCIDFFPIKSLLHPLTRQVNLVITWNNNMSSGVLF